MINKLISKSQVRVLNCENCPNEDYAMGYTRAISDVLNLETIPTLGVDTLEKIKAEIKENIATRESNKSMIQNCGLYIALEIIDKYIGGKDER